MSRYRVSYAYQQAVTCGRDQLRDQLSSLTYNSYLSCGWSRIKDPSTIRITPLGPNLYELSYDVVVEADEDAPCQRDAVRSFLYHGGLPDEIDFTRVRVEELGEVPAEAEEIAAE